MNETITEASQYWAAFFIGMAALGGFGALFIWALIRGNFKNVERPKKRLLEIDEQTEVKL